MNEVEYRGRRSNFNPTSEQIYAVLASLLALLTREK
jgi:hypothetical protein